MIAKYIKNYDHYIINQYTITQLALVMVLQ